MFSPALVCVSVCLSVTTTTKNNCGRICTKVYVKVPKGEREDQVRVSLRSVEGCESNGQKTT